jgi:hypothetical protein
VGAARERPPEQLAPASDNSSELFAQGEPLEHIHFERQIGLGKVFVQLGKHGEWEGFVGQEHKVEIGGRPGVTAAA